MKDSREQELEKRRKKKKLMKRIPMPFNFRSQVWHLLFIPTQFAQGVLLIIW